MKKVSIIVPVYNAGNYIDQSISSIVEQTYSNLEIILIDDGSADDSLQRCKEWSEKDKRIKVFCQENSGVSVTRNKGIELATGEYVMFMDSDDWIDKNMVETLYNQAEEHQADAACCILQENQDGKQENIGKSIITDLQEKITVGQNQVESGLLLLKVWGPVCKLFHREVIGDCRFENHEV